MEAPERKLPRATLGHGDYDSDFSDDETVEKSCQQKNSEDALLKKPFQKDKHDKVAHRQVAMDEWDREEARNRRFHLIAMDAYARHKKFVNDYILYYGGKKEDFKRSGENDKTDLDVIRENHRFLWREEDEIDMNWEKRLSKKYYDKLFKEYCIADLRKYRDNKFGFRWRHEQEVVSAKGRLRHNSEVNDKAQLSMLLVSVCKDLLEGQFSCGSKHCDEKEGLKSWEVNFGYLEHGQKKNALVKLRLCPECSFKLNFHHRKREVKPGKKQGNQEQSSKILKGKKSRTSSPHRHKAKKKKIHEDPTSLEESNKTDEDSGSDDQEDGPSEADFWRGPPQDAEEKTREEEFDEYFQDLFL